MITFSVQQAMTMNRFVGNFKIPAGSLIVFFIVFFVAAILITLQFMTALLCHFGFGRSGKENQVQIITLSIWGNHNFTVEGFVNKITHLTS